MNPDTSIALDRLQASAIKRTGPVSQWLDIYRQEILVVAADRGASMTEELLGLQRGELYSWARRRKISLPKKPKA